MPRPPSRLCVDGRRTRIPRPLFAFHNRWFSSRVKVRGKGGLIYVGSRCCVVSRRVKVSGVKHKKQNKTDKKRQAKRSVCATPRRPSSSRALRVFSSAPPSRRARSPMRAGRGPRRARGTCAAARRRRPPRAAAARAVVRRALGGRRGRTCERDDVTCASSALRPERCCVVPFPLPTPIPLQCCSSQCATTK